MSEIRIIAEPSVYVFGRQVVDRGEIARFLEQEGIAGWTTDAPSAAEALCESGGRLCYLSFSKPRPGGNERYLAHIKEVGHGSVLEHAVWTLVITGISRRCCEQLTRQRVGFSPSQLSQRYVDEVEGGVLDVVISPAMAKYHPEYVEWLAAMDAWEDDEDQDYDLMPQPSDVVAMIDDWATQMRHAASAYEENAEKLHEMLGHVEDKKSRRKQAREAARDSLPNATETKIQVTANARSLRHFLEMRGGIDADAEIRRLALKLLDVMRAEAPNLFGDMRVVQVDGVDVIQTPYRKV